MAETKTKFENIDDYIAGFPEDIRQTLEKIRKTIRQSAPGTEELIHYQMPAIAFRGRVILYFAAFKNHYHITMPKPAKVFEAFKDEIAGLDISKSTIRLPIGQPFPFNLIGEFARFRVKELQ
ncbi:MAG TPA: DUF1801 domain-containing protein [Mucilaginibacter sp.]|nr:DUF1801 domain-containing protein [Mucilaginibacter sp.]